MLKIRRSEQRGAANHGWLQSKHTFSFADYYNPEMMGFRDLRVINEDWIAEGQGFGMHPHRDMEIITYMLAGELQHKDSMGNTGVIKPGEVQHMSAGTGVRHSEFNPRNDQSTHLLQIWIQPDQLNVQPQYGQKSFAAALEEKGFVLAVSKTGREGSIAIHQDADVYVARSRMMDSDKSFKIRPGRHLWIQVARGEISVNGEYLKAGDAVAISAEPEIRWKALLDNTEFLLFDLP